MKQTSKNYPADENEFDKRATEMRRLNVLSKKWRGIGAKTLTRPEKITIRDTKTGKRYGTRTLIQKITNEQTHLKLLSSLLEKEDITLLPDIVVSEIKKNVRTGAKDLQQNWENALELVYKAYQVANVQLPSSQEKGAWKQLQDIIKYAVRQLVVTRGVNGKWRLTRPVISESVENKKEKKKNEMKPIDNRRFFVEVPDKSVVEIESDSIDDIIEQLTNKLRRRKTEVRVEERTKKHVVLSIWKDDVKIDHIVVKEVS